MKVVSAITVDVSDDVLVNRERALTKNSWSEVGSCTRHTFRNVGMPCGFMSVALYVAYDGPWTSRNCDYPRDLEA